MVLFLVIIAGNVTGFFPCSLPGTDLDTQAECEAHGCDWFKNTRGCCDTGLTHCGYAPGDYACSIKGTTAQKWNSEKCECAFCDCGWCCCPGTSCAAGNVIAVTADGRTDTQECIDAGYPGCEFHCCGISTCKGVSGLCDTSCSRDLGGFACCLSPPPQKQVNTFLCNIVLVLWGITAGIATLVITLAGIKWMGSEDDLAARREAKITIVHAIIGLIIVLIALTIVNWIFAGAGTMSVFQFNCAP